MSTHAAVGYRQSLPASDPASLVDAQVECPELRAHDLLVRVEAVSVNPIDTKQRLQVTPDGLRVLGFDAAGTVVAVGAEGGLLDADGNPEHTREILAVDSIAAMAGGVGSVSSNTSYIESAAGVGEGARTGLASVVTGAAFLVSLFLAPLVALVPSEAAAPALVFVGFLMLSQVVHVDWSDPEEGFPAFVTMVAMPFAYSITAGIGAGFLFWIAIKVVVGKAKQVHPLLWVIGVAFLIYFGQGVINAALA